VTHTIRFANASQPAHECDILVLSGPIPQMLKQVVSGGC
jgi:hypothetical protein